MTAVDLLAAVLAEPAPVSAPLLLGATLTGRGVTLRITEVEAYSGPTDPGSHGHRGPTARNASLFGAAGTLYAYRSYGIHTCVNVVSGPVGTSSGILLRGAEVVDGIDVARSRRGASVADVGLARGPGNLGLALGAVLADDDGTSLLDGSGPYVLAPAPGTAPASAGTAPALRVSRGPRIGIAGVAGGARFPWRFWLTGDPTVSAYRRHARALD